MKYRVGEISLRFATVVSTSPATGLPLSTYSVPPFLSTRLKLWLPPKVWFQGSQSTITGARSSRNGQACAIICWFAHSMRCVLTTPFGGPVEPEVNRIFATVSGPIFRNSLSIVEPGLLSSSVSTGVDLAPTASRASLNFSGSEAYTSPGCTSSKMYFSLP